MGTYIMSVCLVIALTSVKGLPKYTTDVQKYENEVNLVCAPDKVIIPGQAWFYNYDNMWGNTDYCNATDVFINVCAYDNVCNFRTDKFKILTNCSSQDVASFWHDCSPVSAPIITNINGTMQAGQLMSPQYPNFATWFIEATCIIMPKDAALFLLTSFRSWTTAQDIPISNRRYIKVLAKTINGNIEWNIHKFSRFDRYADYANLTEIELEEVMISYSSAALELKLFLAFEANADVTVCCKSGNSKPDCGMQHKSGAVRPKHSSDFNEYVDTIKIQCDNDNLIKPLDAHMYSKDADQRQIDRCIVTDAFRKRCGYQNNCFFLKDVFRKKSNCTGDQELVHVGYDCISNTYNEKCTHQETTMGSTSLKVPTCDCSSEDAITVKPIVMMAVVWTICITVVLSIFVQSLINVLCRHKAYAVAVKRISIKRM